MMPPLVILAGGLATRMGEVTKLQPKSLLPVAGMPFIFHQLNWVRKQGFSRVILSIGHLGEKIEGYVGAGVKFGLDITYSTDGPELLGTGGALKKAVTELHEPFFVMYGDSYLQINAEEMWKKYSFYEKLSMMSVIKNNNKWDKSNCDFFDGFITSHSI
jgi:NDP-sugar pyrophosphorylase family protein